MGFVPRHAYCGDMPSFLISINAVRKNLFRSTLLGTTVMKRLKYRDECIYGEG